MSHQSGRLGGTAASLASVPKVHNEPVLFLHNKAHTRLVAGKLGRTGGDNCLLLPIHHQQKRGVEAVC